MPRVSFLVTCNWELCQGAECQVCRYFPVEPGEPLGMKECLIDFTDSGGYAEVTLPEGYCEWEVEQPGFDIQFGDFTLGAEDVLIEVGLDSVPPPPPTTHLLTLVVDGDGTLEVNGESVLPGIYEVEENHEVTITAVSGIDPFQYWALDDGTETSNPVTIIMTQDLTVTAYFYTEEPPPPQEGSPLIWILLSGVVGLVVLGSKK